MHSFLSSSGTVFALNSSARFNTRHKTCTHTQTLSTASRPYCEENMHASSSYLSMHASSSYLDIIPMHLPFFRLMRSLSTLNLGWQGKKKNDVAWRLGSLATRRLIADLPCGGTTQAVSPPTLFAPRPPTNLLMLHFLFYHSFTSLIKF